MAGKMRELALSFLDSLAITSERTAVAQADAICKPGTIRDLWSRLKDTYRSFRMGEQPYNEQLAQRDASISLLKTRNDYAKDAIRSLGQYNELANAVILDSIDREGKLEADLENSCGQRAILAQEVEDTGAELTRVRDANARLESASKLSTSDLERKLTDAYAIIGQMKTKERFSKHIMATQRSDLHKAYLAGISEGAPGSFVVIDHRGNIHKQTQESEKRLGKAEGINFRNLIFGTDAERKQIESKIETEGGEWSGLMYLVINGSTVPARIHVVPQIYHATVHGETLELRHSTKIEVEKLGLFGRLRAHLRGGEYIQDSIRKDDEEMEKADKILAEYGLPPHGESTAPSSSPHA